METNPEIIGKIVLDAALAVHRELGPGLLESAYQIALCKELSLRGFNVQTEVAVHYYYKGEDLGKCYYIDILVNDLVLVEVKAVEEMKPVFVAQLITYLKLYKRNLGYLINFNVPLLKDGFRRVVHNWSYHTTKGD
jgi:GxxExxY protein